MKLNYLLNPWENAEIRKLILCPKLYCKKNLEQVQVLSQYFKVQKLKRLTRIAGHYEILLFIQLCKNKISWSYYGQKGIVHESSFKATKHDSSCC